MKKKEMKSKLAEKIVDKARKRAYQTVGRSWPMGVHEVEVPKELKKFVEEHERTK